MPFFETNPLQNISQCSRCKNYFDYKDLKYLEKDWLCNTCYYERRVMQEIMRGSE
jgi:formylmethanofuran dehydrogenase subunit E